MEKAVISMIDAFKSQNIYLKSYSSGKSRGHEADDEQQAMVSSPIANSSGNPRFEIGDSLIVFVIAVQYLVMTGR